MLKLLIVILAAVLASIFAMNNMQRVEVSLIVGKPVHVRLFFLLMTSFLVGSLSAVLANLYVRTKSAKRKTAAGKAKDDDFFPE